VTLIEAKEKYNGPRLSQVDELISHMNAEISNCTACGAKRSVITSSSGESAIKAASFYRNMGFTADVEYSLFENGHFYLVVYGWAEPESAQ
jgi:hypothetical protein